MLRSTHRLKKKRDIEIAFEKGRFLGADLVTMKVWAIDPAAFPKRGYSLDDLKFAFVVGKKIHKSAVKRNRLKRQMREVVRLLIQQGDIQPGFLVIVMAKKEMLDAPYATIAQNIEFLLKKARMLK